MEDLEKKVLLFLYENQGPRYIGGVAKGVETLTKNIMAVIHNLEKEGFLTIGESKEIGRKTEDSATVEITGSGIDFVGSESQK